MKKAPPLVPDRYLTRGGAFLKKMPIPQKNSRLRRDFATLFTVFGVGLPCFFILKTVVLAYVLQNFRAYGALFLSTRFYKRFVHV